MCLGHTDTKDSSLSPGYKACLPKKAQCACLGGESQGPWQSCLNHLALTEPGSLTYFYALLGRGRKELRVFSPASSLCDLEKATLTSRLIGKMRIIT